MSSNLASTTFNAEFTVGQHGHLIAAKRYSVPGGEVIHGACMQYEDEHTHRSGPFKVTNMAIFNGRPKLTGEFELGGMHFSVTVNVTSQIAAVGDQETEIRLSDEASGVFTSRRTDNGILYEECPPDAQKLKIAGVLYRACLALDPQCRVEELRDYSDIWLMRTDGKALHPVHPLSVLGEFQRSVELNIDGGLEEAKNSLSGLLAPREC